MTSTLPEPDAVEALAHLRSFVTDHSYGTDRAFMLAKVDAIEAAIRATPSTDLDVVRVAAEAIDAAMQASLDTESVRASAALEDQRWIPADALRDLPLPCPMRSSLTDAPCVLSWNHPAASTTRFHQFVALGDRKGEDDGA